MKPFLLYLVSIIIHLLPETRCFKAKSILYRIAGVKIGTNVRISSSVKIIGNSTLHICDNTWLSPGSYISCSAPIYIGSNCDIGPQCYIGTGTHFINNGKNKAAGKGRSLPIKINSGCWLGARSVILPNVEIGECSIIAAGAVVTSSINKRELWGGCPAKFIKRL